jgi:AcrR family transcriptional regulator
MPSAASGEKTRLRLIGAAQDLLGTGRADATVQEITKLAKVGVGSFYTHFIDKAELYEAAATAAQVVDNRKLGEIARSFEDQTLGFIASVIYACGRPKYDPKLNRIILTAGPRLFAASDYLDEPRAILRASVEAGRVTPVDVDAWVASVAGAYQNLLALMDAGVVDETMPRRMFWLFAQQLGYSEETYLATAEHAEKMVQDTIAANVATTTKTG